MVPPATGRSWAALVGLSLSCSQPVIENSDGVNDPCAASASPEIQHFCIADEARGHALKGEASEALAACDALKDDDLWRDECFFLTSEALLQGPVQHAVAACLEAGQFNGQCTAHVLWYRKPWPVGANPSDPEAPAKVQAYLANFPAAVQTPAAEPTWVDPARHVRARAWHDVYVGTGNADPTAARAATGIDAAPARTVFALEAVRLLGKDRPLNELISTVEAVWDGGGPPITGPTLETGCWAGWFPPQWPRKDAKLGTPQVVELMDGGLRLVSHDPDEDLLIATLEAIWAQRRGGSPSELAPWLSDERDLVRWTAAHLAAASLTRGQDPPTFSDDTSQAIAAGVIREIRKDWGFIPKVRPQNDHCE